ncbi:branched-chain amino acid ABC transporter substrate-binding protein [Skermanella stibiiresistens SB22]|uniref:Branched-chain amino acid ABC transporter substrate-binding protein n=1 Tax=Skermanella stibiiresistens SB22 TaxID=1385369 RepID=W9GVK1_9PROT|nr:ABC transporter ATP-binding protein [Skermanella stibiiresistens]EWY36646.1 branched-chain amino acid ABC transporter substrate-binding protein [Skermanella stibiiresistens SB22]
MLETRDLYKRFGGLVATNHVSLSIEAGELHAIIGPNGAGKTTLIAQLAGELRPDGGAVLFDGRDVTALPVQHRAAAGLARSFQITSVFPPFTALANVALAVQAHAGHSFRFWRDAARDGRLTGPARQALDLVGLGPRADVPAELLSHGERRQLEIAMALATGPRMLLLDEPMAGMGPAEGAGMVELLRKLKGHYTILLVEHDMDAVFALADWITVLVNGAVIATGTPDEIRSDPEVRRAYLGEETV